MQVHRDTTPTSSGRPSDRREALDGLELVPGTNPTDSAAWRLRLFARMWAVAALFHLAGNAREALTDSPAFAAASTALAAGAAVTLLQPRLRWLMLMCTTILVTAWYEAPVVGNHWVLASAVSLALLLAPLRTRMAGVPLTAETVWAVFLPTARATLLVAYALAAFAKLNSGFFDPAVSCAVYYHNQLVSSWGLSGLQIAAGASLGRGLAVAAAFTEACVALGLACARTRRAALVLATSFHWLLAMDLLQHFWDFSAVLFAGFVLFLDEGQVAALRKRTSRGPDRPLVRPTLLGPLVVGTAAVVGSLAVLPVPSTLDVLLVLLGHLAWWGYGTTVVLIALLLVRAGSAREGRPHVTPGVMLLVPVLVLFNGLTPYLELKTGFGWNMYSNLRTVAGESNHFLVPSTLDLTGAQVDQVRIIRSSDPSLDRLRTAGYAMAYSEFREYARAHPDIAVTYERGGRVFRAERLVDDEAAQGSVSAVGRRLQSFRVIDLSASERCQPAFSPAR